MKFIVIGLGNFGTALCLELSALGHEVIGADSNMSTINAIKDKIFMAINLDSTDFNALNKLPFKDADLVVVGIGEDFGASVLTTAYLKQLNVSRIICRAISPIHEAVFQAFGISDIIHPEQETARRLALRFQGKGIVDSFELSSKVTIFEIIAPEKFVGSSIREIDLRGTYNINIVTILKPGETVNIFGKKIPSKEVFGVIYPDYILQADDILVLFGNKNDIEKLMGN